MFRIIQKGNFNNTERFLSRAKNLMVQSILERYGKEGVAALARATPKDSGRTAESWDFRVFKDSYGYKIEWFNTNVNNGTPIALLIQYGHGTGTGGYVPPTDFINPAMKPIFDNLAEDLWKEVTKI